MEWQQATADNGQPYWFNTRTRETTWTMPQQPAVPQQPPPQQPPPPHPNYNNVQVARQPPQAPAQRGLFACVCMLPMGEPPTKYLAGLLQLPHPPSRCRVSNEQRY